MADIIQTQIFVPSPYFSFRWTDYDIESPYNTLPLDSLIDYSNYHQPVQIGGGGYQSDKGQIQVISDFVPTCGLYTHNNVFVKDVPMVAIDPPITGVSFICYNGEVDFSDVDPGCYYLKITYTDENDTERDWRTSYLDAQIHHDSTQRFDVSNNGNDKGAVFVNADNTLQVIQFRVASQLRLPVPKSDAEDYEDQYNELTQENSIPFVTLTQLIGGPELLPFWVIEKINLLYSLTNVLIDGQPFAKLSGSEFKPSERNVGDIGAFWEVDIQPNTAYPSDVFVTADPAEGDYIVIKQARTFKNQSANFAFAGNFTAGKNLIRIAVVNNGGDEFTMLIGTTNGGAELGTIVFPDDNTDSIDIGKLFTVPTTVYISGIAGTNLDITFDWNDYLAKNIIPPVGGGQLFAKNTLYFFDEIEDGSFETEFDIATGLGNVGTDHEGCALADGRNGTPDRTNLMVKSWDRTNPSTRGTNVGAGAGGALTGNEITQTGPQVGSHVHETPNSNDENGYGKYTTGNRPQEGPTMFVNANQNQADVEPMNIQNDAWISVPFYYIGT